MIDWALREIVINIVKARPDKSLLKNRNMTIRVKLSLFVLRQLNCYLPLLQLCQVRDLDKKWLKIASNCLRCVSAERLPEFLAEFSQVFQSEAHCRHHQVVGYVKELFKSQKGRANCYW